MYEPSTNEDTLDHVKEAGIDPGARSPDKPILKKNTGIVSCVHLCGIEYTFGTDKLRNSTLCHKNILGIPEDGRLDLHFRLVAGYFRLEQGDHEKLQASLKDLVDQNGDLSTEGASRYGENPFILASIERAHARKLETWYKGHQVHWIPPRELSPHPFNRTIYSVELDAPFTESIRLFGVKEPIIATRSNKVLSGERRLLAAIECSMTEVPMIYTDAPEDCHELLIIHLNRQRQKTPIVNILEYIALKKGADVEAKLRKLAGKPLLENFPQGLARDHAAKDSGLCGKTLDNAAKAYLEAMRRRHAGLTPDEVAAVLAKLEHGRSYSGAHTMAVGYRWFEKAKPLSPTTKKKGLSKKNCG